MPNHIVYTLDHLTGSVDINKPSVCFTDKQSNNISLMSCYEKSELICVKRSEKTWACS